MVVSNIQQAHEGTPVARSVEIKTKEKLLADLGFHAVSDEMVLSPITLQKDSEEAAKTGLVGSTDPLAGSKHTSKPVAGDSTPPQYPPLNLAALIIAAQNVMIEGRRVVAQSANDARKMALTCWMKGWDAYNSATNKLYDARIAQSQVQAGQSFASAATSVGALGYAGYAKYSANGTATAAEGQIKANNAELAGEPSMTTKRVSTLEEGPLAKPTEVRTETQIKNNTVGQERILKSAQTDREHAMRKADMLSQIGGGLSQGAGGFTTAHFQGEEKAAQNAQNVAEKEKQAFQEIMQREGQQWDRAVQNADAEFQKDGQLLQSVFAAQASGLA